MNFIKRIKYRTKLLWYKILLKREFKRRFPNNQLKDYPYWCYWQKQFPTEEVPCGVGLVTPGIMMPPLTIEQIEYAKSLEPLAKKVLGL